MAKKKDWKPDWRDGSAERRRRLLGMVGVVAGTAAAGIWAMQRFSRSEQAGRLRARVTRDIHVRKTYTINRQPDVVYGFWRSLENLPRFMKHLESVEVIGERRSRWRAKGPAGFTVEWEAEITYDHPNERIGWQSLEGSTVPNRGYVRFDPAPGARGTEVRVELIYEVPGGRAAQLVAKLFGEEPESQIDEDLRRLKQILEAGEISVARPDRGRDALQPAESESLQYELARTGGEA
jgi:uncharacterized membrane protein